MAITDKERIEITNWLMGIYEGKPTPAGSFLTALAKASFLADDDNYLLLLPALIAIKAKYPKYGVKF